MAAAPAGWLGCRCWTADWAQACQWRVCEGGYHLWTCWPRPGHAVLPHICGMARACSGRRGTRKAARHRRRRCCCCFDAGCQHVCRVPGEYIARGAMLRGCFHHARIGDPSITHSSQKTAARPPAVLQHLRASRFRSWYFRDTCRISHRQALLPIVFMPAMLAKHPTTGAPVPSASKSQRIITGRVWRGFRLPETAACIHLRIIWRWCYSRHALRWLFGGFCHRQVV